MEEIAAIEGVHAVTLIEGDLMVSVKRNAPYFEVRRKVRCMAVALSGWRRLQVVLAQPLEARRFARPAEPNWTILRASSAPSTGW